MLEYNSGHYRGDPSYIPLDQKRVSSSLTDAYTHHLCSTRKIYYVLKITNTSAATEHKRSLSGLSVNLYTNNIIQVTSNWG